jgi:hypothetical protein
LPSFNPSQPDDATKWSLPASAFIGSVKPDGN